jgi:6-phosphogluconolactonase
MNDPTIMRRDVLKGCAATMVTCSLARRAVAQPQRRHVFISSAYNASAAANGITTFRRDDAGTLKFVAFTQDRSSPSFLTLHPTKNVLYAANEVFPTGGRVSAYHYDTNGSLGLLNHVASANFAAPGPTHISVHPSGQFLLTASWGGAYISAIRLLPDGSLGSLTDTTVHNGNLGPNQTQARPHMIAADPSGNYILVQDLGQDRTYIYTLDLAWGTFRPGPEPFVSAQPGAGPRHFAFHPDGLHLYSINEVGSILNVYLWSPEEATLRLLNSLSTLPPRYVAAHGVNTAAEIAVSNDGGCVYGSNRGFDSIVAYSTARYGRELRGAEPQWTWVRGECPRQFALAPDGRFLYCGNSTTNTVTRFEVGSDGSLHPTGDDLGLASPTCIIFGP